MAEVELSRDSGDWNIVVEALGVAADAIRRSEEERLQKFGEDFEGFASGGKAAAYSRYIELRDEIRIEVRDATHEDWVRQHPELEGVDCDLCHAPIALTGCTRISCPLRAEAEASGAWLDSVKERLSDPSSDGWSVNAAFARNVLAGRRVRLRAGAEIIGSTHPHFERGDSLRRETVVNIHAALPARPGEYRDDPALPAEITWAGSGGYWRTAKLEDVVELIVEDPGSGDAPRGHIGA